MASHDPSARLAFLRDAIPLVAGTADRAARFPNPDLHQRTQRLDTGCIEYWDGTQWTVLANGVTGG